MRQNVRNKVFAATAIALVLIFNISWHSPSRAFIQKLYSLKEVMDASKVIALGEVEEIDDNDRLVIVKVTESLKGKCPFKQIRMNIGGGHDWHPEACMKHLKVGDPIVFFYDHDGSVRPCVAYCDGMFIQIFGNVERNPENPLWLLTHIELLMNRTYSGKTTDLINILKDVLAGKIEPPAPDEKLPPLTRDELLGVIHKAAKPIVLTDNVDGYEDAKWPVQNWGRPAVVELLKSEKRGRVIHIEYDGEAEKHQEQLWEKHDPNGAKIQNKVAVARVLTADFSNASRLLFEASNQSDKPISIGVGINTNDWQYFECPPIQMAAGQRKMDLSVDLLASNFKCEATKWEFKSKLLSSDHVSKLTFVVNEPPLTGTLFIDRVRLDNESIFIRSIPLLRSGEAAGVSWTDIDGDGRPDAFICGIANEQNKDAADIQNRLYRNIGGDFEDFTEKAGIKGASRSAAWADFDGDGQLDLIQTSPLALWKNNKGVFTDTTASLPAIPGGEIRSVGWLDVTGSGRADLLIATADKGLCILSNQGSGPNWFKDATAEFGLQKIASVGAPEFMALGDLDGNGFTDIFYNRDRGLLARNDDGKGFKLVSNSRVEYQTIPNAGAAFGDFDNDGNMDLFVPQAGKPCLFHNNNDGTFTNIIDQSGALAKLPANARCAAWGDVNMDGKLDLVVGFADAPAMIFLNLGNGRFAEGISLEPFKCAFGAVGMAFADFDGDGDLDLLISGKEVAGVLVNGCPRSKNVGVRIRIPTKEAPGALVRMYDSSDHSLGVRQVGLISGLGSQDFREAVYSVPPGNYKASVLLTNGTVRKKLLTVDKNGLLWDLGTLDAEPTKAAAK